MAGKHIFSVNVDFSQRELLNAVLQNLFQAPLVPIEGQVYYDSFYNVPHYWNDSEWIPWERPIHRSYVSQVEMIGDQPYQLKQFIYFDGSSYWEYLGTTVGDISDYRLISTSPVHIIYNTESDLLNDQGNQYQNYIYYVISTKLYYQKLLSSNSSLSDYNIIISKIYLENNYVPYTGATKNVNLGEFGLTTGNIVFDTTPTNIPEVQGATYWDIDDNTLAIIMNGAIQKVGEDSFYPVKNQTGTLIPKGMNVRFAGTLGSSGKLLIAPFIANGSIPSSFYMGVTMEDIANGDDGKVMWFGRIRGINTNSFNEEDILYASTTTAGGFQTTVPLAPNNIIQVAAVINKSSTNGVIFVRPTLGSNINKDEGVRIVTPLNNQSLVYNTTNQIWENKITRFGVKNSTGGVLFYVDNESDIRFEGGGDTSISFNSTTRTVIISSTGGSSGGTGVVSFNGRDGAVTSQSGDYNTSQVAEVDNLYFTEGRVRSTPLTGITNTNSAIVSTDSVLIAFGKTQGQLNNKQPLATNLTSLSSLVYSSSSFVKMTSAGTFTLDTNVYLTSINLGYTPSPTNGVVTNSAGSSSTIPLVDITNAGLMSPADKIKLNGISANANNYIHPSYTPISQTLTGSTVLSTLITDSIGSVLSATTRTITLSDLGYSGVTNADYYGNWVLHVNGSEFYVVESEDIINIEAGDNITIDTSGNTITISSQDTVYTHPIYTPIDITLTGSTVLSTLITDSIGSVLSATTRTITLFDLGAQGKITLTTIGNSGVSTLDDNTNILNIPEYTLSGLGGEPAFSKGNFIIPIDSGLSYTGTTENRLVGSGDLTIINNDKGSDQNIFKQIKDLSGNTVISATTNNDFIQIEGQSGTTVTFESGNRVLISSPEQDNFVRIHEISASTFNFDNPILPQVVTYINNLSLPIDIKQTDSKYNIVIKGDECEIIIELINKGKGLYGTGNNQITINNLLIIEDNCGLCCDNFVRVLYVPCDQVDINLPLKKQIANYINQLDPPLVIEKTDSKYNIIIDCEQSGSTVSCESGIDVLFVLDYTGSMRDIINNIKTSINDITQEIVKISGGNYRLALVIFDEYFSGTTIQPNYSNSSFYNQLLSNDQVYINNGINNNQYITLVTDFSINNITEFETNISKILSGTTNTSTNFPLGNGINAPEPYDIALDVCINGTPFTGTTRTVFLKQFRNNVNKQIILITDDLPSGVDDNYTITDINFISGQLKNDVLSKNIKLSMLSILNPVNGIPNSQSPNNGIYLETFTFDGFNKIFTINNYPFGDLNIQINNNNTRLNLNEYSVNTLNKTVTINNNVSLVSNDIIKIIYRSNAIFGIVKETNGIYVKSYSPDTIKETIQAGCTISPPSTIIYEITGYGLGNTPLSSCLNYNSTPKIYTYCSTISIGCELYYDDEGSVPINNFDYISINDIVYQLSNVGEIIAISSFNCNNIISTFFITGVGYANDSQDACDDAVVNNRSVYSDCDGISIGCNVYIDQYGLIPLTGYTKIFINSELWDINSSTGELLNISFIQCSDPIITYTYTNSGYGNTSQDACDDADSNNRTIYSNCSFIGAGCIIYTDINGLNELTGYTKIFINNNNVWDIDSSTGELIAVSSTQCELPVFIFYTGSGYGNNATNACNDAIISNRTLYSNCSVIDVGCEIYTDINGNFPLTGYNNVSINSTVWDINLGNIILSISDIQC